MRWPFAVSLALHGGALVALCVFHGSAQRGPVRVATLTFMLADERDVGPEIPDRLEPPEPLPVEVAVEPEAFPAEAEEPEPIDFSEFGVEDPAPEPPPVPRRVRIAPLPRPARKAPAPAPAAAAMRVTSAMPRGDRCRPPEYPVAAQRARIEGRVVLRVVVGGDGSVLSVDVEESSGAHLLDEAAVAAVREWTFEPAREDGRAVESVVHVPFRFRLRG